MAADAKSHLELIEFHGEESGPDQSPKTICQRCPSVAWGLVMMVSPQSQGEGCRDLTKPPSDPAAGAIQGTKSLDHPSRRHEEEGGQDERIMVAYQQIMVADDGLSKAVAERVARTAENLPNVRRWVVVVSVYSDESTLLLSMY